MENNYLGVKIDRATHERAMQKKINTLLPQVEASLKALNEGWNDAQKMYDATNYMSQYVSALKQYGVEQTKLKEIEDILDSLNTQQGIFAQFTNADEYNKAKNRVEFAQNATGKSFDEIFADYQNSTDKNEAFAHTFAYIMTQDFDNPQDKLKAADFLEKNLKEFAQKYGAEYASEEQRDIYDDVTAKISQLKRTGTEGTLESKAQELEKVKNNEDFNNQNLSAILKPLTELYNFENKGLSVFLNGATTQASKFLLGNLAKIILGSAPTTFMDNANDDELKVLGYYIAKGENDKAKEYINAVENRINKRTAQEEFEKTEGQHFVNILQGIPIGVRSMSANIAKNFDTRGYVLPTKDEYLSEKIYADLEDYGGQAELFGKSWGQVAFGGTSALGNMIPAVALSFIPYVGTTASGLAMGLSASGSAYREMKNLGYSDGESRTYSIFVGASETALNALLGGIAKGAGSLTDDVMKTLGNVVDKAGFKIAINLGSRFAGEGLEEFLQAWLEPTFKGFVMGDWDYDDAWAESLESALIGGVMGIGFGGISAVQQGLNDAELAKMGAGFRTSGNVAQMVEIAKNSGDKNIREIVKNVVDGDISNTDLGKIIYEYTKKAVNELNGNTTTELTKNFINLMREADNKFEKSTLGAIYSAKSAILNGFDPETLKENNINTEVRQTISKLGQALNRKIRIEENLVNEAGKKIDGYFDENTGEIVLNADAQNPVQVVLKHELTHSIEHVTGYKEFAQKVFNESEFKAWLRNKGYKNLADAQDKTIAFRKKKSDKNFTKKGLTKAQLNALADQELLADFIAEKLFTDTEGLNRMLEALKPEEKRSWLQKILDVIRNLINKIKGVDASVEQRLKNLEKEYIQLLKETTKNEKSTGEGVKYDINIKDILTMDIDWDDDNHSSIKTQLKQHSGELEKMEEVANVTYDKAKGKPYYEQLNEVLKNRFGYKIQRRDFGTISFDDKAIQGVRKYINSDAEAAALIAAPDVLKKGKAISGHKNHKNKGFPSVVFAAPALLNGKRGNVAVSVLYGQGKRVHSIRVLTPEGNVFLLDKIKNTEPTTLVASQESNVEPTISTVSNDKIPQTKQNVNIKSSIPLKNNTDADIRHSITDDTVSTRSALADALSTLTQDESEMRIIEDYKNAVTDIDKAQARLDQVNADIKQILFTPGQRDTQALENLNKEKAELENQISKYDKKLLQMEALAPLQKLQNRAVRNQKRADTEKFKEKNIGKKSTVLRNEIKDRAQKLTNILKNETKAKHIPTAMQKPVAEFLEIFDMNTAEIDKRIARYDELIANETDTAIKEELQKTRDRLELQGLRLQDKLEKMESVYRDIKNSTDEAVQQGYDETIEGLITTAKNSLSSTNLKDLTYEQLNTVNTMFKALEKHIRDANKLKESAIKESVEQAGQTVIKEVSQNTSEKGNKTTPLKQFVEKYGITLLKPVHAFQLFGSDMLNRLFLEVRKGEDVVAVDAKEAKQTFRKNAKESGYWKWDKETRETFKDKNGKEFTLNLEEKLALYAYSKREQADLHLEIGGIVFGDEIVVKERNKFKVEQKVIINDRNTYKIDKQIMADIINTLTAEQKQFADKMQEYLSVDMAKKGNTVSDALYGINLFGEKAYFPLKSSSDFRAFNSEQTGDPKIANKSFTNPTIPGANNPVVLQGFMEVWAKHCVDMAMYHGLTLPMENFTKVYNYSEFDGEYSSVKNTLAKGYGEQVTKYIESLLTDINGGIRQDPNASVVNKLISLFKKSAVFASLSVIVQQPSSIARAFAYIDPKYVKPTQNPLKEYEECKQYCPVAIIKDMGYFDTSVGKSTQDWITEREITDYENNLERLKDGLKIGDNLLASLPATADAFTWGLIWSATKQETAKQNGLDINSAEVKKQSAERFNEIIINTQVYDSVLSRPAIMRSKDVGMKTATAFLAEPLTSVGMATLGVDAARKGDTKKARRLIAAVATQSILNSVLVSFVYAMRDDDEKMSFGEKYLKSLTVELIEGFNPATYIPIVKDVYSLCQGYDVKRADMNLVADLVNATNRLWSENATPYQKIKGMVGSVASLLGIPVKNLWRDIESLYNTGATIKRNTSIGANNAIRKGLSEALPFGDRLVPEKNEATMLYEAVVSGNKKQIKTFRGDKDETQYSSMLRKGLKSEDSRIYEAANARISGDFETYENIVAEIESEGHFESDIIIGAIESTMDISVSGNTMYDTSDINRMLEEGNTSSAEYALNKLIDLKTIQYVEKGENEKTAQRKAESSVKSGITTYWKERYIEAYNEKTKQKKSKSGHYWHR